MHGQYIHSDSLPAPPTNVRLISARNGQITIAWDPLMRTCEVLYYKVTATNCGTCQPNVTASTNITCLVYDLSVPRECNMNVQTVVCDDIVGNRSNEVRVNLRGKLLLYYMLELIKS